MHADCRKALLIRAEAKCVNVIVCHTIARYGAWHAVISKYFLMLVRLENVNQLEN